MKTLVEIWTDMTTLDDNGDISMMHALVRKTDDSMTCMAFHAMAPEQIWKVMALEIGNPTSREVIFGIDRYSKPGQGIETPSLVTLYRWDRELERELEGLGGWTVGVVPYDDDGLRSIIWSHPYWTPLQLKEIEASAEDSRRRSLEAISRMGLPSEVLDEMMAELYERHDQDLSVDQLLAVAQGVINRHRTLQ